MTPIPGLLLHERLQPRLGLADCAARAAELLNARVREYFDRPIDPIDADMLRACTR